MLGGYSSYQEHYEVVKRIVLDNERKYTLADVEGIETTTQSMHGIC